MQQNLKQQMPSDERPVHLSMLPGPASEQQQRQPVRAAAAESLSSSSLQKQQQQQNLNHEMHLAT